MRASTVVTAGIRVTLLGTALAIAGCNRMLGPSARDANWRVYDSTHVALNVRPGSFAEQHAQTLGAALDDQYETTLTLLDARFDRRISGFLYNSGSDGKLPSDRSGTAFVDTLSFEATCTPPYDGNLLALLGHEANHVVIVNAIGRAGTYMMNEGLASALLSERYHELGKSYYYAWTQAHRPQLPALATLADDDKWNSVDENTAYSTSASFLAYLLETQGAPRLRQLYYARSADFVEKFGQIYGRSLDAAQAEWLEWCAKYSR